ncbi:MAG: cbb3-type cytochrome c oxidase subunit II [Acidimicrobiia bacterium]
MTAETSSNDVEQPDELTDSSSVVRLHFISATIFLVLGVLVAVGAAFQLVLPELFSGVSALTYGKLAPAGRALLADGWLTLGLLGATYYILPRITMQGHKRSVLATASLIVISVGVIAGVMGILFGFSSGLVGNETPIWARAILAIGYLLAAISVTSTARARGNHLGAAGWYLTAAPIWLTLSAVVGLIPASSGIAGSIQFAFVNATFLGLFVVTASVGLLYFIFSTLTGTDPTEPRPLSALGFWSLTLIWANLAAVALVYTPVPDWYETISIAFAIGALIPLFTIAGDISLMIRGRIADIKDRQSLRYAVVSSITLATATIVTLLWAWRATSSIAQYTTWVNTAWVLVILGGGSYAVFAIRSLTRGGAAGARSTHYFLSTMGLVVMFTGLAVGALVVGFSWAAGSASQTYADAGQAWNVTAESTEPFLWIAALGMALYAVAQFFFAFALGRSSDQELTAPATDTGFDLEFEGALRYATWKRLTWGTAAVFIFAATMTLVLPIADDTDREGTLLADTSRTYAEGTSEALGRDLYISEGCTECHTQVVRPIGTDVGLGPVTVAGDYANEKPALLGAYRFGPDLMHVASRGEFFDKVLVEAHLKDPRSLVPWSTMPSYSYLSEDDIGALVSYIETLK